MSTAGNGRPVSTGLIARYYDSNTRYFQAFGGSGDVAAIHRAIYAPGVGSTEAAFNYLNSCVAEAIKPCISDDSQVLDLGCGVGGTATWLAQSLAVNVTGITISSIQQQLATERAQQMGVQSRCTFIAADFAQLPQLPVMDAAFAIESFVHARSADSFFAMVAARVREGGRLVICDDFLNPELPPQADFWIQRFKCGWYLNQLHTLQSVIEAADRHGFKLVGSSDLSAYVRGFPRPLLWLMRHLTRLPLPWTYWHNLAGGTALQYCIQRGWTRYHVVIFEYLAVDSG
jgi:cyclopropane fatty-acyl-phospholipid synthase-like methyltransferase